MEEDAYVEEEACVEEDACVDALERRCSHKSVPKYIYAARVQGLGSEPT